MLSWFVILVNCKLSILSPKSRHFQWRKPSSGWKIETNPSETACSQIVVIVVYKVLKRTMVDDENYFLGEEKQKKQKNKIRKAGQIKNTLHELGVSVSKSTIKRRLHQSQYRTTNPQHVSLKNRKIKLYQKNFFFLNLKNSSGTTS